MPRCRHAIDSVCEEWARTRRQLLGLSNPRTQSEFIGAMRCSLGNVQRHHDGAGSYTTREQHFPELYQGDALLVNLAFKRMPLEMRTYMDLHFTLGRGATVRAELLGLTVRSYWERVGRCRTFVEGYFASQADRAA